MDLSDFKCYTIAPYVTGSDRDGLLASASALGMNASFTCNSDAESMLDTYVIDISDARYQVSCVFVLPPERKFMPDMFEMTVYCLRKDLYIWCEIYNKDTGASLKPDVSDTHSSKFIDFLYHVVTGSREAAHRALQI